MNVPETRFWLDLFTGKTWQEFQAAGSRVTGFRERNWKRAANIKPGDIFLCYLTGVKRWVGLLEVSGERYKDDASIFSDDSFPVRFPVRPPVLLTPQQGVPMEALKGKLSFYPAGATSNQWTGLLRSSPTRYDATDGELIAAALHEAAAHPIERPVDLKKLARSPNLYKLRTRADNEEIERVVSVPAVEEEENLAEQTLPGEPTHTEIQWRLLDLGSQIGLKIWAPRSDRNKTWGGKRVGDVPNLLKCLPSQFDKVTNKTIENIDVLWLSRWP